jgi:hypothetical protein
MTAPRRLGATDWSANVLVCNEREARTVVPADEFSSLVIANGRGGDRYIVAAEMLLRK